MVLITTENGKVVFRDGLVGTEQSCCCPSDDPPECRFNEDCGEGRYCCDGYCQDDPCKPDCAGVFNSTGWFTDGGKQDLTQLLVNAGYVDVVFTPTAAFPGSAVPYTDGCGQTFYTVTASCCGQAFGCVPAFTVGNVRGIDGPGNQFPPCGAPNNEQNFIDTCCNPLP
jgi:hypothetical protein